MRPPAEQDTMPGPGRGNWLDILSMVWTVSDESDCLLLMPFGKPNSQRWTSQCTLLLPFGKPNSQQPRHIPPLKGVRAPRRPEPTFENVSGVESACPRETLVTAGSLENACIHMRPQKTGHAQVVFDTDPETTATTHFSPQSVGGRLFRFGELSGDRVVTLGPVAARPRRSQQPD